MKRLNKTKLILLLTIITFLSGINKASAITCQYKLPFPGVDGNGNVVDVDGFCTYGTGSSTTDGCSISANIDSSRSSYSCTGKGFLNFDANKKNYSWNSTLNKWGETSATFSIVLYGSGSSSSFSCSNVDCPTNTDGMYLKTNDTVCPKYIVLHNSTKESNYTWLLSLLNTDNGERCGSGALCNNHYFNITTLHDTFQKNAEGKLDAGGCYNPDYATLTTFPSKMYSVSDSTSDFKNNLKSFSSSFSSYEGVYLPLYMSDDENKENNQNIVLETTKAYREVVVDSWTTSLKKYESNLNSLCGNNWYERINIKNYGFSNSKDFINYGRPTVEALNMIGKSYNSLNSYDNDISAQCWNARSEYLNKAKSFVTFMTSIGSNVDGVVNEDDPFYLSFTYSDSDSAALNWKYMNWWYTALRIGIDGPFKDYKTSSETLEEKASLEQKIATCWEAYSHIQSSEGAAIKKAECEKLEEENRELAKQNMENAWHKFAAVDVNNIGVDWNFAKYTPKCSDVVIFTDIWQAMRIIAPFLLIIFGSLDYFKAVIASDMEAMKKAKSKFPKRLIAFLLLLIIPSIISIIMKATADEENNTTYFKCIVTGDKGDGE